MKRRITVDREGNVVEVVLDDRERLAEIEHERLIERGITAGVEREIKRAKLAGKLLARLLDTSGDDAPAPEPEPPTETEGEDDPKLYTGVYL